VLDALTLTGFQSAISFVKRGRIIVNTLWTSADAPMFA